MTRADVAAFFTSRLRADVLFIILGGFPIGFAYFIDHKEHPLAFDLCKDFGVVIISLALVDILWQLVAGGEPLSREIHEMRQLNTLTRQAYRSGLLDVAERRSELLPEHASFTQAVRTSGANIDISGYSLHILVENQRLLQALIQRAKNKVKVRILLCAPENGAIAASVQDSVYEGLKGEMMTTWNILLKAWSELSDAEKANFDIKRLGHKALSTSIFRIDDILSVVHYLHSTFTTGTPIYIVEGPDRVLFKTYLDEFDHLFALGDGPPPTQASDHKAISSPR
jgi:hypothetical protein